MTQAWVSSVPVLPRTRVTLTSLTGALEESIFATDRSVRRWENRSPGRDAEGAAELRNFDQIQLCGAKIAGLLDFLISAPSRCAKTRPDLGVGSAKPTLQSGPSPTSDECQLPSVNRKQMHGADINWREETMTCETMTTSCSPQTYPIQFSSATSLVNRSDCLRHSTVTVFQGSVAARLSGP